MTKLQDLPNKAIVENTDQVYLFDAAGVEKNVRASVAAVRAIAQTETLTNKTINSPATAKPVFASELQLPGAKIVGMVRGSGNLAVGVLAGGSEATVTLAVTGLVVGSAVIVNSTGVLEAGLVISYSWVSAANTLSVRVRNTSASATIGTAISVNVVSFQTTATD